MKNPRGRGPRSSRRLFEVLGRLSKFSMRKKKHWEYRRFLLDGTSIIAGEVCPRWDSVELSMPDVPVGRVLRLASRWAGNMEQRMKKTGACLGNIASEEFRIAGVNENLENLSVEEQMAAIEFLKRFWIHGQALANNYNRHRKQIIASVNANSVPA